jgi:cytochrome P450
MAENTGLFGVDLEAQPEFKENPFPLFDMLRENQPVFEAPMGIRVISRYEDVGRLLRSVKGGMRLSDGTPVLIPQAEEGAIFDPNDFVLFQDGAAHTRIRKLLSIAFRPTKVENLRAVIEAVADECVDRAIAKGELDMARDVAQVVPSAIICKMLGVPLEDRERFTQLTADATHALASQFAPEEAVERAGPAADALYTYFSDLIGDRRSKLGDDLLSEMIRAEEGGDRLSFNELICQSMGLLAAGFETTIGLIGLGMRQLLLHPDELARLRADPGLIETAVEECLRFDPPIIATMRVVHEEVEFHDHVIPKDTRVAAIIAAANRDPRAFEEPGRFDIGRSDKPHFSFGAGTHLCLGVHLARLEAQIAIGTVVRRLHGLELESPSIEWGDSLFRVPGRMPIAFSAAD